MTMTKNISLGAALQATLVAGLIAAALNIIIYFIARSMLGGPLAVDTPATDSIDLIAVILFSVVPALGAGAIYWGLDRFMANPKPTFLVIAALVFIGFLFPPIFSAESPITGWALELMHGVVAVPVVMAVLGLKE